MAYLYMHTYDTKIGGLNTLGYPVIVSGENSKGETTYTIRKTPSQTETINANDLEKITVFKINADTATIKACAYSLNQDKTYFRNLLIEKLQSYYSETMAKNYAAAFSHSAFDIERNKNNEIVEKLLNDFDSSPESINNTPSEISSVNEQNPNYYYEHVYFVDTNKFTTNIYKVKSTGLNTNILCQLKGDRKKKIHNDVLDVILKVKDEHKFIMFSKNADISDFQNAVLNEIMEDMRQMECQTKILAKCIAYGNSIAKGLYTSAQLRTKITELHEFSFKDGKYTIKTHNIISADISHYGIDNNVVVLKNDIDKLQTIPTEWTDKYRVGGTYIMYSEHNDMSAFKKAIKDQLSAISTRIEILEIPGAKRAKDAKSFTPNEYYPDITNYIKIGNKMSTTSLVLYRFIRDGLHKDNRGVKFTATTIPFVKTDDNTYTIYEEKDGSICKIAKDYMQNLQIDSNGNMSMWLETPNFEYFVDRVIIELTSEANTIAKIK